MPGFDQTGPEGIGPLTRRRLGRCPDYGAKVRKSSQIENLKDLPENYGRRGFGYGRGGRGRVHGMGFRYRFRGGE
jgi:hypothetical protein